MARYDLDISVEKGPSMFWAANLPWTQSQSEHGTLASLGSDGTRPADTVIIKSQVDIAEHFVDIGFQHAECVERVMNIAPLGKCAKIDASYIVWERSYFFKRVTYHG